jgi:hypothetical protein
LGGAGFKTIAELEEIEARASAIAQLTREGLFTLDAVKNAGLIAERTKQILEQMSGITEQIRTAEDLTENVLEVEKEKTSELAKQTEQLARQEASRQNAIRDIRAEVALMEARLTGNKELEESLLKQADFNAAFEKTRSTEDAENFAATKAAERAALAAAQSRVPGGGGGADPKPKTAMDRIRDAAAQMDVDAMTEESRMRARGSRGLSRADELEDAGHHRTAAQIRAREERRRERDAKNFEDRQAKNSRREELEKMGPLERSREQEKDRKLAREQERMAKEGSKTEKEREREEKESGGGGGGKGKDPIEAVATKLDTIIKEITERLPQNALS